MGETREETRGEAFERLLGIVDHQREPDGCPWDQEQNHKSIRLNAIEEVYELGDAIDADDDEL